MRVDQSIGMFDFLIEINKAGHSSFFVIHYRYQGGTAFSTMARSLAS